MLAYGPLTLHSVQTHPASLLGALYQPCCERPLSSRLQEAFSFSRKKVQKEKGSYTGGRWCVSTVTKFFVSVIREKKDELLSKSHTLRNERFLQPTLKSLKICR